MIKTSDGHILITGKKGGKQYLAKLDSSANIVWENTSSEFQRFDYVQCILESPDQIYAVFGAFTQPPSLIVLDLHGNQIKKIELKEIIDRGLKDHKEKMLKQWVDKSVKISEECEKSGIKINVDQLDKMIGRLPNTPRWCDNLYTYDVGIDINNDLIFAASINSFFATVVIPETMDKASIDFTYPDDSLHIGDAKFLLTSGKGETFAIGYVNPFYISIPPQAKHLMSKDIRKLAPLCEPYVKKISGPDGHGWVKRFDIFFEETLFLSREPIAAVMGRDEEIFILCKRKNLKNGQRLPFTIISLNVKEKGAVHKKINVGDYEKYRPNGLTTLANGDLVVIGKKYSTNPKHGNSYLQRMTGEGKVLWEKEFKTEGFDYPVAVVELDNGDLIVGCNSGSVGPGLKEKFNTNFWLIKLDKNGTIIPF